MGSDYVEGEIFKISFSYNSSIGTYTYVKSYDKTYLEQVKYSSCYNGSKGMTGCSTTVTVYFKALKCGSTKIILGNEYRGKKNNSSIKVKIKKNDGKTQIKNALGEEIERDEDEIDIKREIESWIKVILLGDSEVGKTNLLYNLFGKSFQEEYIPTISPFHFKKKLK